MSLRLPTRWHRTSSERDHCVARKPDASDRLETGVLWSARRNRSRAAWGGRNCRSRTDEPEGTIPLADCQYFARGSRAIPEFASAFPAVRNGIPTIFGAAAFAQGSVNNRRAKPPFVFLKHDGGQATPSPPRRSLFALAAQPALAAAPRGPGTFPSVPRRRRRQDELDPGQGHRVSGERRRACRQAIQLEDVRQRGSVFFPLQ
jgi:hypothetical protein